MVNDKVGRFLRHSIVLAILVQLVCKQYHLILMVLHHQYSYSTLSQVSTEMGDRS